MRYIPTEAVYLQLTAGCPRFPKLDSVYMHNDMTVIAMSAEAVVQRPERETLVTEDPLLHQFRSYSGEQLIEKKTPRLSEVQVCKIATQLLQAMMYLEEMNMVHEDMSHRNYLVDEYLNVSFLST